MQYERPPVTSHIASIGLLSLGTKPVSLSIAGVPVNSVKKQIKRIIGCFKI